MKIIFRLLVVTFLATSVSSALAQAPFKIVGYVLNDQLVDIDYDKLTHLNVAFENPDDEGVLSYSPNNNTYISEGHDHGVKVLVSICGGAASGDPVIQNRYFNLINDANRSAFIDKIVTYVLHHGFDGVDVDLEGPAINNDYGDFIEELAEKLRAEDKLITAALSQSYGGDRVLNETLQIYDFLNVMAYDQTGPWNPSIAGQHSSYNFALTALNYWTGRGITKDKAILGVPFYGYGFGEDFNQGIGFKDIIANYPGSEFVDEIGNTIYYNGIPTIKNKSKYVVDNNYGGIMIWQLGHDATGMYSLLTTVYNALNNIMSAENHQIATEAYPNPAATFFMLKQPSAAGDFTIKDMYGRTRPLIRIDENSIDVSMLESGVYLVSHPTVGAPVIKMIKK